MEGLDAELDAEKGQVPPTMHTMATLGSLVLLGFALTKTRSNYTSAKRIEKVHLKTTDYLDISTYISLNYLHQQEEASFYKVWPMLGLKWTYSKNACTTPTSSFDDSNPLRVPCHLAEELDGLDAWKSHDGNQEQGTYSHHLSQTGIRYELGVFRKPACRIRFLYDFSTKQHFLYETTWFSTISLRNNIFSTKQHFLSETTFSLRNNMFSPKQHSLRETTCSLRNKNFLYETT